MTEPTKQHKPIGLIRYVQILTYGAVIGTIATFAGLHFLTKTIPSPTKVQEGFVNPSDIEITCDDLDKNTLPEAYMGYKGRDYAIVDVDGEPRLRPYSVLPAEVIVER